jgi:hypothetical protein
LFAQNGCIGARKGHARREVFEAQVDGILAAFVLSPCRSADQVVQLVDMPNISNGAQNSAETFEI